MPEEIVISNLLKNYFVLEAPTAKSNPNVSDLRILL